MQRLELRQFSTPTRRRDAKNRVGTERRDHAAGPTGLADLLVVREPIGCGVRRRQHFDIEALEQRARTKLRALQFFQDLVVDAFRSRTFETDTHTEDVVELVREPRAGRRAAEEMKALSKALPCATR